MPELLCFSVDTNLTIITIAVSVIGVSVTVLIGYNIWQNLSGLKKIAKKEAQKTAFELIPDLVKKNTNVLFEEKINEFIEAENFKTNTAKIVEDKLQDFVKEFDVSDLVSQDLKLVVEDLYNNSRLKTMPWGSSTFIRHRNYEEIISVLKDYIANTKRKNHIVKLNMAAIVAMTKKSDVEILSNDLKYFGIITNTNPEGVELKTKDGKTIVFKFEVIDSLKIFD